jgi:hypothetical protein
MITPLTRSHDGDEGRPTACAATTGQTGAPRTRRAGIHLNLAGEPAGRHLNHFVTTGVPPVENVDGCCMFRGH